MLKAAIIIDNSSVTKWQLDALVGAADQIDIKIILSCENTINRKKLFKNFFYYLINFLNIKNKMSGTVKLDVEGAETVAFNSTYEGSWQKMPEFLGNELKKHQIDVIIKFGMSLLRVDGYLDPYKILSFHHGDPSRYRGRPAGFYELLHGEASVGTIVQELSNKLDAGKVWAMCHSKIDHHSYKKTAINFYSKSGYLLRKALINISENSPLDVPSSGKIYRLPSNTLALKFIGTILTRQLRRLFYGIFYEKKWNIGTHRDFSVKKMFVFDLRKTKTAHIDPEFSFYADPFFSVDGKSIRAEALDSTNGLGQIIEIDADTLKINKNLLSGPHFSYPFSFAVDEKEYLVPEVSSHSAPYMLSAPFDVNEKIYIRGLEKLRVVDSNIHQHKGLFYLFCGLNKNSSDCLYLFYSNKKDGMYIPHRLNPIVIDPSRARMGGNLFSQNGKLYRLGQNNSYGYGDGLSICEIRKLSALDYEEAVVGDIRVEGARGPHTVDTHGANVVFDFYYEKFSLLAWYRRLLPTVKRRFNLS